MRNLTEADIRANTFHKVPNVEAVKLRETPQHSLGAQRLNDIDASCA